MSDMADLSYLVHDLSAALEQLESRSDDHARKIRKRTTAVSGQRRRSYYSAFAAARPRHLRGPDEPMTPNPEEDMPKRIWEKRFHEWREGLRNWYAEHGQQKELAKNLESSPVLPDPLQQLMNTYECPQKVFVKGCSMKRPRVRGGWGGQSRLK